MMDTLGVRLKYYRKEIVNMTQSEFAEKVGVTQGHITHWENDKVKPDAESLTKIMLAFPLLNPAWLVLNVGSMEKPNQPNDSASIKRENDLLNKVVRLQEKIERLTSEKDNDTK